MKQILLSLVLSSLGMSTLAQSPSGKISGKVSGVQTDGVSISLLNSSDSSIVKFTVSDKTGSFSFPDIKPGTYLIQASAAGAKPEYSSQVAVSENGTADAGTLTLQPASKNMKEVVVTSKKQFIERKIDKTVLNVDASITNAGSTAMEVLERAPGVQVDNDGNISLKGKQGVIVMMDGKPSYMSGTELANFLRGMPASTIDQIEIMTNPSAKYDASGNSGIINIRTKKQKLKGFNGSLALAYGQGEYPKTNNSLTLNYRINKVNMFGTFSGNYREWNKTLNIKRLYSNPDGSPRAIFDQEANSIRSHGNYNAKLGMDYYAGKRTTIGFVLTGYTTPGSEDGVNISYLKSHVGVTDSIVKADMHEKYTWKNGGINLNFRHQFDSAGTELTADLDYLTYSSNRDQNFFNNTYHSDWSPKAGDQLAGKLPSDIHIYSAKMDLTRPFKNGLKMEAGVKTSFVKTDNIAGYFNVVGNDYQVDYEKTNRFEYEENINAAYVSFSKTIGKWGLQAGVRVENTRYDGYQHGNDFRSDSAFSNSYTNAFPTTYITYESNSKNQWGLSFGRRIDRPDYEDLNPFLFFLDKYTYGSGNPYLRPTYSNNIDLSHTYNRKFTTTLSYSLTTDMVSESFRQDGLTTIQSNGNYGKMHMAGISFEGQFKIAKWWSITPYTEIRYRNITADLYGERIDREGTYALFHTNNQFTFKKGWAAEAQGFYRTKIIQGQLLIKDIYQVQAGVSKQVLKNKGSVKLTVRDIFKSLGGRGNISMPGTEASFRQTNDSRVATISFNYRFGKPIKGIQKRKTGGASEEQNRIKSSN